MRRPVGRGPETRAKPIENMKLPSLIIQVDEIPESPGVEADAGFSSPGQDTRVRTGNVEDEQVAGGGGVKHAGARQERNDRRTTERGGPLAAGRPAA